MTRLEKPTIILLGGFLAAALVFGIGKANNYRLEANVRNLQTKCVEEGKKETLWPGVLLCDPMTLYLSESSKKSEGSKTLPVGIQAKIVAAQEDLLQSQDWFLPVAIAVLAVGALPWFWY